MTARKKAHPFEDCAKKIKSLPPAEGSLRVWHIPQVPGKCFYVHVDKTQELPVTRAVEILKILANYDLFQYEGKIKPDYCNAQGLQVFEGGEWVEWMDEDGNEISDIMRRDEE
jgi:hypothetical protein